MRIPKDSSMQLRQRGFWEKLERGKESTQEGDGIFLRLYGPLLAQAYPSVFRKGKELGSSRLLDTDK